MNHEATLERFFEALVNGDRREARSIIDAAAGDLSAEHMIEMIFWPAHEMIDRLRRSDQLSKMGYHYATRLLRTLVDQNARRLSQTNGTAKTVFACCGSSEGEELGAQMAVDLIESRGMRVCFAGGGLPSDEILAQVHELRPDYVVMFASAASDLPGIREVIDTIRTINASPNTQIAVGAGVFKRAEGLAEEMGADLYAGDPLELVEQLTGEIPEIPAEKLKATAATPMRKRRTRAA